MQIHNCLWRFRRFLRPYVLDEIHCEQYWVRLTCWLSNHCCAKWPFRWIGGVQVCLVCCSGLLTGRAVDRGYLWAMWLTPHIWVNYMATVTTLRSPALFYMRLHVRWSSVCSYEYLPIQCQVFMLSLSHENRYYQVSTTQDRHLHPSITFAQVFLAQAICHGLSAGLCYTPSEKYIIRLDHSCSRVQLLRSYRIISTEHDL
jgi:hypothetical protein